MSYEGVVLFTAIVPPALIAAIMAIGSLCKGLDEDWEKENWD